MMKKKSSKENKIFSCLFSLLFCGFFFWKSGEKREVLSGDDFKYRVEKKRNSFLRDKKNRCRPFGILVY